METVKIEAHDKRSFTMIPNYIVRDGSAKSNHFHVLMVIASYAWEDRACTASVDTLAYGAGVGRHTVISAIKEWERKKVLSVERKPGIGTVIKTRFDFTASAYPGTTPIQPVLTRAVPTQAHKEDGTVNNTNNTNNTIAQASPDAGGIPLPRKRTDIQETVDYYLDQQQVFDEQRKPIYGSCLKPAKQLLVMFNGNVDRAKEAIVECRGWSEKKGLSWSLNSVVKNLHRFHAA